MSFDAVRVTKLTKSYPLYSNPLVRFGAALGIPFGKQGEFVALDSVDFSVLPGESVGILGTNGSGKSTLLQIIAGTGTPTSGEVVTRGTVAGILELGAGFLPDLTGRENALLNSRMLGMTKDEAVSRLPWIEDFADIQEHFDMPVRSYSSGMFVRLAFAVAASVQPDVLIVDEAMAVGDVAFQQKCFAHMRSAMAGAARLFVSHDVGVLPSICERSIVLDRGKVVFDGPTRDAVIHYLRQAHAPRVASGPDGNILESGLSGPREIDIEGVRISVNEMGAVAPGDRVELEIDLRSDLVDTTHLVVGMNWMDETGRIVFGRNTADQSIALTARPGKNTARVGFTWPRLRPGTYDCTVGIADRGMEIGPYRLQCWAHRAVSLTAVTHEDVHGMVAIDIDDASSIGTADISS